MNSTPRAVDCHCVMGVGAGAADGAIRVTAVVIGGGGSAGETVAREPNTGMQPVMVSKPHVIAAARVRRSMGLNRSLFAGKATHDVADGQDTYRATFRTLPVDDHQAVYVVINQDLGGF